MRVCAILLLLVCSCVVPEDDSGPIAYEEEPRVGSMPWYELRTDSIDNPGVARMTGSWMCWIFDGSGHDTHSAFEMVMLRNHVYYGHFIHDPYTPDARASATEFAWGQGSWGKVGTELTLRNEYENRFVDVKFRVTLLSSRGLTLESEDQHLYCFRTELANENDER